MYTDIRSVEVDSVCELVADLVEGSSGPVSKPVQHTPSQQAAERHSEREEEYTSCIKYIQLHRKCSKFAWFSGITSLLDFVSTPTKPKNFVNVLQICENFLPREYIYKRWRDRRERGRWVWVGYLLKRAGEVAALSFSPSEEGFIVNTTWRFLITCHIAKCNTWSTRSSMSVHYIYIYI